MKNKIYGFLAVGAVALAMASTASAAELCAGVTDVTTVGSAGCYDPGDPSLIFSNFVVSVSGATSVVVGIPASSTGGGNVDLEFQLSIAGETVPGSADVELSYTVTGGLGGIDDNFQASPLGSGGSVTITEIACSVPFLSTGCPLPASDTLANYAGVSTGQVVSDSATFAAGIVSPVYIKKDIDYSDAAMSEFTNSQFTGVPEPMTFSLIGAGLLGLGFMGRRRLGK
jgi:hypothetical protein